MMFGRRRHPRKVRKRGYVKHKGMFVPLSTFAPQRTTVERRR
jgi:hypothetical protein